MNIKFLTAQQSWALNEVRGGVEVEDWQDEVSFAATLRSLHRLHPDLITIEESKRGPTWFWARPTPQGLELLDQRERTSEDEAIEARNLSHEDRWLLFATDQWDVADAPLGSSLACKAVDLAHRHPHLVVVQETPRGLELTITEAGRSARALPRPPHPAQLRALAPYAWGGTILHERDGWWLRGIASERPELVRLEPSEKPIRAKATYAGLMELWRANLLPEHPDKTLLRQEWAELDKLGMSPMGWLGLVAAAWDTTAEPPPSLAESAHALRHRLLTLRLLYPTQSPSFWVLCGVNVVLNPIGKAVQSEEEALRLEAHWTAMSLDSASMPPWETQQRLDLCDRLKVTDDKVARSNICRVLETWSAELAVVAPELVETAWLSIEPLLWRTEAEELRVSCGLAMERYTPAGRWVTWMSLLAYPWAKAHGIPWAQSVAP